MGYRGQGRTRSRSTISITSTSIILDKAQAHISQSITVGMRTQPETAYNSLWKVWTRTGGTSLSAGLTEDRQDKLQDCNTGLSYWRYAAIIDLDYEY